MSECVELMLLFAGATDRADCLPCSQPFSLPHTLPETETKQRAVENRRTASSSNVELDCDGGEWQWKSTRNTRVFSVNMKCTNYIERERCCRCRRSRFRHSFVLISLLLFFVLMPTCFIQLLFFRYRYILFRFVIFVCVCERHCSSYTAFVVAT